MIYEFDPRLSDLRMILKQSSKKRVRHARMLLHLGLHDLYMSWPAYRELGYRHTCRTTRIRYRKRYQSGLWDVKGSQPDEVRSSCSKGSPEKAIRSEGGQRRQS